MEPAVRLEHSLVAVETDTTVHVMLELTAPDAPPGPERPPLALALVIDRSGSMHGSPLETPKACAAWLARSLGPTDRLALITYDDNVELVAPLQTPDADRLATVIAGIDAGGTTNLSGGWLKGLEVLKHEPDS